MSMRHALILSYDLPSPSLLLLPTLGTGSLEGRAQDRGPSSPVTHLTPQDHDFLADGPSGDSGEDSSPHKMLNPHFLVGWIGHSRGR